MTRFDWNEFLTLAEDLKKRPGEGCRRSAISRAYYWVWHQTRTKLDAQMRSIADFESGRHTKTWATLASAPMGLPQWAVDVADIAQGLLELRHRADYKDAQPIEDKHVAQAFEAVAKIHALFQRSMPRIYS